MAAASARSSGNTRGVPRAAHIGLHHEHVSKFSQRCDRTPSFIGGRSTPAREHDVTCAVSQHPLRNLEAEPAEAAGDQIARIRLESASASQWARGWGRHIVFHREHDFPDVARLRHVAECGGDLRCAKDPERKRMQLSTCEHGQEPLQHRGDQRRSSRMSWARSMTKKEALLRNGRSPIFEFW